jgi:hypothetical protein
LSARSRDRWREIMQGWRLDPIALASLETALRALDEAAAATEQIEREGVLLVDPRGRRYQHPLLRVRTNARRIALDSLRTIKLADPDPKAPRKPGRPLPSWLRGEAS